MLSHLRASPAVGAPDITITVEWQVGDDLGVPGLTTDDELRLITSGGVVVSRTPLRNGTFEGMTVQQVYEKEASRSCTGSHQQPRAQLPRFTQGQVDIVCPPFAGGFVACIVDGESFKRLLAIPLRVSGATPAQRQTLSLNQFQVQAMDCLVVTYNDEEPREGDIFVVVKRSLGDNTGLATLGVGPLSHCTAIYQAPYSHKNNNGGGEEYPTGGDGVVGASSSLVAMDRGNMTTLSIVAPKEAGEYQVRLMSTPLSGIPYTRCVSANFTVQAGGSGGSCSSQAGGGGIASATSLSSTQTIAPISGEGLKGEIKCSKYQLFVGQEVEVHYKFETQHCGGILSELDSIMFYPYGRSEEAVQGNGLATAVGEGKYEGTLTITAPLTEGVYDLAYYSFADQRPLLTELKPIRVDAVHATLEHHSEAAALEALKVKAGKATGGSAAVHHVAVPTDGHVTLRYCIDTRIYSKKDRLIVHDELTNVVDSNFVDYPSDQTEYRNENTLSSQDVFTGLASASLYIKGQHTVYYYSYVLKRKVARLAGFIDVNPPRSLSLPTANLTTLAILPTDQDIHVGFAKEGNDTRPYMQQQQDCIALYDVNAPDFVHTHTRDCGEGMCGALQVYYLRGSQSEKIQFQAVRKEVDVAVRCLIAVNGHFHRVCTSECVVTLKPKSHPGLKGFQFKALHHVSLNDVAPMTHRFSPVQPMQQQLTSSGSMGPGSLGGGGDSAYSSPTGRNESRRSMGAVSIRTSTQAAKGRPFKTQLHFTETDELRGAIMPPKVASTTSHCIVTYHISEGLARGEDMVALVTDDLDRVVAECAVNLAQGRPDYSMGTVTLYPPRIAGRYIAVYFSSKFQSIVFTSETFRVVEGQDELAKATGKTSAGGSGGSAVATLNRAAQVRRTISTSISSPSYGLSTSSHTSRKPRTRFLCICVGYLRRFYELSGPLNDAERFPSVLSQVTGLELRNPNECRIYTELRSDLLGPEAPHLVPTAENIRQGLHWLTDGAQPRDQLILYFSGAGSRLPSKNNAANASLTTTTTASTTTGRGGGAGGQSVGLSQHSEDGMENVLLPTDFDWNARVITYSELNAALFDKVPNGTAVSAIVDACFTTNPHDICGQWNIWREDTVTGTAKKASNNAQQEEQENRGMAGLWRRREAAGIPARTPWRCVAPPRGMFPVLSTAPDDLKPESSCVLGPLFQPYTAAHTPVQQDGNHALFVMYESCRGTKHQPQGAWDVFNSKEGKSLGLFTSCLIDTLEEEMNRSNSTGGGDDAAEDSNSARSNATTNSHPSFSMSRSGAATQSSEPNKRIDTLQWWEFHEKVCRRMKNTAYGQHQLPRLLVGDVSALGTTIFNARASD